MSCPTTTSEFRSDQNSQVGEEHFQKLDRSSQAIRFSSFDHSIGFVVDTMMHVESLGARYVLFEEGIRKAARQSVMT